MACDEAAASSPATPLPPPHLLFTGRWMHVRVRAPPTHTQIILRKGYHLLAMALFLPAFWWDLPLLVLSLGVAFAALVALELARCARIPGVGPGVQRFMEVGGLG